MAIQEIAGVTVQQGTNSFVDNGNLLAMSLAFAVRGLCVVEDSHGYSQA